MEELAEVLPAPRNNLPSERKLIMARHTGRRAPVKRKSRTPGKMNRASTCKGVAGHPTKICVKRHTRKKAGSNTRITISAYCYCSSRTLSGATPSRRRSAAKKQTRCTSRKNCYDRNTLNRTDKKADGCCRKGSSRRWGKAFHAERAKLARAGKLRRR